MRALLTMTNAMTEFKIDGLDRGFLERTLRTTLALGAVLSLWLVQTLQMPVLGGFAAGVLLGVAGLASTMWAADCAQGKSKTARWRTYVPAAVMVFKAGLIYLSLRVLVWRWAFSPAALCVGASLVMIVIVLKVIGRNMAPVQTAGRR